MCRILTLDLLRHGETQGGAIYRGRTDSPLTPLGERQMKDALSLHMSREQWQAVYSSPLQRCLQVADEYCQAESIPLHLDDRLQELDFGDWDGLTLAQVWEKYPDQSDAFWRDPASNPPPGGESTDALQRRLRQLLEELYVSESTSLLLITHGGVIRALIAMALELPSSHWSRLELGHGSVSRLRIGLDKQQRLEWISVVFVNQQVFK